MAEKLVYTVKELADVLKISLNRAYDLTKSKDFPVVQLGKKHLIPIADLEHWLSAQAKGKKSVVLGEREAKNGEV